MVSVSATASCLEMRRRPSFTNPPANRDQTCLNWVHKKGEYFLAWLDGGGDEDVGSAVGERRVDEWMG